MEDAYQRAYQPFLEMLERHPKVKFNIHSSGSLMEWMMERHPEYLQRLKGMVNRGQAEILGGGLYEPLLTMIPERDRIDQLRAFSSFLLEQFGCLPRGIWLTERVWEPGLVDTLCDAGIEYTVVDDTHFTYAGLSDDALDGYYLTENECRILKVFPGSMKLRYLVPFHPVEETITLLKRMGPDSIRVLADDGEKFGLWPGTFERVYERGWLAAFLTQIESAQIKTMTFGEALNKFKPRGRVYLPCASYEEMGEWVLEPNKYEELKALKKKCIGHEQTFVQGGYFKNFLVKYPEANIMHKRMVYVSKRLGEDQAARRELWRGQASCAYWHGIFGGLYLPHLRSAIYEHLIAADNMAIKFSGLMRSDFDCDGEEEIIFSNSNYFAIFKPRYGAALELDFRPRLLNLTNVLSRRPENYHERLRQTNVQKSSDASVKSIHELLRIKEAGLDQFLKYDRFPHYAFRDFIAGEIMTYSDSIVAENTVKFVGPKLTKTIYFKDNQIELVYQSVNEAESVSMEISLGLFEDNIKIGDQKLNKQRSGQVRANSFAIINQDKNFSVNFDAAQIFDLHFSPIETVSMSEQGLERNYQGTIFQFNFTTAPMLTMRTECW